MIKKYLVLITIFVSLMCFVSATESFGSVTSAPPALPIEQIQETAYVSIPVYSGWNLIKLPSFNPAVSQDSQLCSEKTAGAKSVTASDISAVWIYDPIEVTYHKKGTPSYDSFLQNYPNIAKSSSVWVKVNRNCLFYADQFKTIDFNPLKRGWNFLSISEDLIGAKLGDYAGNCNIVQTFYFDATKQEWKKINKNDIIQDPSMVGQGLLTQVINDCELGELERTTYKNTGTVNLTLTDAVSGFPVENSKVVVYKSDGHYLKERETDSQGKVSIEIEGGLTVYFDLLADDYEEKMTSKYSVKANTVQDVKIKVNRLFEGMTSNGDYFKGGENAYVDVEAFLAFNSGLAKEALESMNDLIDRYGNLIKVIHKDFPTTYRQSEIYQFMRERNKNVVKIDSTSFKAAEAARCAGDQGKYFEYYTLLFQNISDLTTEDLKKYARSIGLNSEEFNECLDTSKHKQKILDSFYEGINRNVSSMPTFLVNGSELSSFLKPEAFYEVIAKKLEEEVYGLQIGNLGEGGQIKDIYDTQNLPIREHPRKTLSRYSSIYRPEYKVTILEFCDATNEECKKLQPVIDKIFDHYEDICLSTEVKNIYTEEYSRCLDEIRLIHKDLPKENNALSYKTAEAIKCAAQNGEFVDYQREVYKYQDSLHMGIFDELGYNVGLDTSANIGYRPTLRSKFDDCIKYGTMKQSIESDIALAEKLGVTRTPTLFINGYKVEGFKTFEELKPIIDEKIGLQEFLDIEKRVIQEKRTRGGA